MLCFVGGGELFEDCADVPSPELEIDDTLGRSYEIDDGGDIGVRSIVGNGGVMEIE